MTVQELIDWLETQPKDATVASPSDEMNKAIRRLNYQDLQKATDYHPYWVENSEFEEDTPSIYVIIGK